MGRSVAGVRPLAFPGLADENIHPDVVVALVARGKDVVPAAARGLIGASDEAILAAAHAEGRVVLTHDADFGALAVRRGVPFTGIIHLRPGHILAAFVVGILDAIESRPIEVTPPFILVAHRRGALVRIRVRRVLKS